jgi:phospholipase C
VTWDEHGGFADHVAPPNDATPPGGSSNPDFAFTVLGPRVPAVLVSPWIPRGRRDGALYEHTAIPRALRELFAPAAPPLSAREAAGSRLLDNLALDAPRSDVPITRPAADLVPDESLHVMSMSAELAKPPRRLDEFQESLVELAELVDEAIRAEEAAPMVPHAAAVARTAAAAAVRPRRAFVTEAERQMYLHDVTRRLQRASRHE